MLPQIEIPVETEPAQIPQPRKKKESPSTTSSGNQILDNQVVQTSFEQNVPIQRPILKKQPGKKFTVNTYLTGIESSSEEEDFYDEEFLRKTAGLESPTEKELEDIELPPLG